MVRFPCRVQTAGIQGVLLHIKPQPMLAERLCSNHFSFSRLTSSDLRLDTSLLPSLGIEEVIYIYIYIITHIHIYIYLSLSLSLCGTHYISNGTQKLKNAQSKCCNAPNGKLRCSRSEQRTLSREDSSCCKYGAG